MSVTYEPDRELADAFYWQLTQPADPGSGDVELVLGPIFADWEAHELQPVMRSIGKKLQGVASMLLSQPLTEAAT